MITSWEVYWVMQLDTISAAAGLFAFVGILVGGLVTVIATVDYDARPLHWLGVPILLFGIFSAAAATFLPSSKTAAAMILVPALTSDQVLEPVGAEARQLYDLAKQALTNLAMKEPAPVEAEKK